MIKKTLSKKNIFYSVILLIFITLTIILSIKHEHWADEANTWLIASDLSIIEMIKYIHLDGHPILFHLIIKLFLLFGLTYKYFSVISILFSSLGVGIFLFKSRFKWYIKAILPFTYFIFYQYTVVVRGYCLILFLLGLIAIIWDKRKEKCILFTFLLTLLLSSEAYTFIIAGSIFLILIYDYLWEYLRTHNIKYPLCLIFLLIVFILTALYVVPKEDNLFNPTTHKFFLSNAFITSFGMTTKVKIIASILILLIWIFIYFRTNRANKIQTFVITIPLFAFMLFRYCNLWHYGIVFILFIFLIWIHKLEGNKILNIFLIIVCIFQIYYSIDTSIYDYNNNYDSAYDVANFIKQYDYKNMKIHGYEFHASSVNAYFDQNIFYNWNPDIRFFYWHHSNIYYRVSHDVKSLYDTHIDMFVAIINENKIDREAFREYYNEYVFDGYTYFQNQKYEPMTGLVYVRKDIDIQKQKNS